jgi:hypothetical protein
LDKRQLLINITIGICILIISDLLFDFGPLPSLIISFLFSGYVLFLLSLPNCQTRAYKLLFYTEVVKINLYLLSNKLLKADNIDLSIDGKISLFIIVISVINFSFLIAGLENVKILGLNQKTQVNIKKLLMIYFISIIVIQSIIRLS